MLTRDEGFQFGRVTHLNLSSVTVAVDVKMAVSWAVVW